MDPRVEVIPERRAKSWKREHEERCRRHIDYKRYREQGNVEFLVSDFHGISNEYVDSITDRMEKMDESKDYNEGVVEKNISDSCEKDQNIAASKETSKACEKRVNVVDGNGQCNSFDHSVLFLKGNDQSSETTVKLSNFPLLQQVFTRIPDTTKQKELELDDENSYMGEFEERVMPESRIEDVQKTFFEGVLSKEVEATGAGYNMEIECERNESKDASTSDSDLQSEFQGTVFKKSEDTELSEEGTVKNANRFHHNVEMSHSDVIKVKEWFPSEKLQAEESTNCEDITNSSKKINVKNSSVIPDDKVNTKNLLDIKAWNENKEGIEIKSPVECANLSLNTIEPGAPEKSKNNSETSPSSNPGVKDFSYKKKNHCYKNDVSNEDCLTSKIGNMSVTEITDKSDYILPENSSVGFSNMTTPALRVPDPAQLPSTNEPEEKVSIITF